MVERIRFMKIKEGGVLLGDEFECINKIDVYLDSRDLAMKCFVNGELDLTKLIGQKVLFSFSGRLDWMEVRREFDFNKTTEEKKIIFFAEDNVFGLVFDCGDCKVTQRKGSSIVHINVDGKIKSIERKKRLICKKCKTQLVYPVNSKVQPTKCNACDTPWKKK